MYSGLISSDREYVNNLSEEDLKFYDRIIRTLITSLMVSNVGSKEIGVPPQETCLSEIERQIEIYFDKSYRSELITPKLKSMIGEELFVEFCSRVEKMKKENASELEFLIKKSKKLNLPITIFLIISLALTVYGFPFLIILLVRKYKISQDIKKIDVKATNNLLLVAKIRYMKLNMIPTRGPLVCVKTNMNKKTKPDNTK